MLPPILAAQIRPAPVGSKLIYVSFLPQADLVLSATYCIDNQIFGLYKIEPFGKCRNLFRNVQNTSNDSASHGIRAQIRPAPVGPKLIDVSFLPHADFVLFLTYCINSRFLSVKTNNSESSNFHSPKILINLSRFLK